MKYKEVEIWHGLPESDKKSLLHDIDKFKHRREICKQRAKKQNEAAIPSHETVQRQRPEL